MKMRILAMLIAVLAFAMLFTACSKGEEKQLSDTDAAEETTASTTAENLQSQEGHDLFKKFESVTVDGEKIDYTVFEGKITMVNILSAYSLLILSR